MVQWITLFSKHKLPTQLTSISHWHESVNILIIYYPLTHSHLISRLRHTIILSPFWYLLRKLRETTERRIRLDILTQVCCAPFLSLSTLLLSLFKRQLTREGWHWPGLVPAVLSQQRKSPLSVCNLLYSTATCKSIFYKAVAFVL